MPDIDPNAIKFAILQFKIPMAFDVLDCTQDTDNGTAFLIVLNDTPAQLRIKRIYDYRYKESGYSTGSFSKTEEDRCGIISHSSIQLWFDKQTLDQDTIDRSTLWMGSQQLLDRSIAYLNKFITLYRALTDEFWLRNVVKKDVFGIAYTLILENADPIRVVEVLPSHHALKCNGGKEFQLEADKEKLLRHLLQSEYMDVGKDFLLDMQDKYSLGNYNMALVQSVTYFEHYVYSRLKDMLSKTKLDKVKKKAECGCMAGISEVCERGILEILKNDFGSTAKYADLKRDALSKRNLIVHGEQLTNVTREECDAAISSVISAVEQLENDVFKEGTSTS